MHVPILIFVRIYLLL